MVVARIAAIIAGYFLAIFVNHHDTALIGVTLNDGSGGDPLAALSWLLLVVAVFWITKKRY